MTSVFSERTESIKRMFRYGNEEIRKEADPEKHILQSKAVCVALRQHSAVGRPQVWDQRDGGFSSRCSG